MSPDLSVPMPELSRCRMCFFLRWGCITSSCILRIAHPSFLELESLLYGLFPSVPSVPRLRVFLDSECVSFSSKVAITKVQQKLQLNIRDKDGYNISQQNISNRIQRYTKEVILIKLTLSQQYRGGPHLLKTTMPIDIETAFDTIRYILKKLRVEEYIPR